MLRVRRVDFRLTRRSLEKADRRRFEHHARSADDAEMERPGRTVAHNSAIEPRCGGLANGKELTIKIQMIPLSQLVPSADNVRKTGVNEGIESLAASLRVHGLFAESPSPPCRNKKRLRKGHLIENINAARSLRRQGLVLCFSN